MASSGHGRDGEGNIKPPPPTLTIENAQLNRNCSTRADPDLIESSGRVKMLDKAMSLSVCREPMRTETALR
jgi:hypothetical protein